VGFIRSERVSAAILLAAAALGLLLANLPFGPALVHLADTPLPVPALGLDLTVREWISDGLLAIFFFIVAVELKRELVAGDLSSPAKATLPAIAALGGVAAPALIYAGITASSGAGHVNGWPIPTATDIAFALGVLAIFGRAIPQRVRTFLLALAVLDDLIAILIIAFFFTDRVHLPALAGGAAAVAVFWMLSRLLGPRARRELGRPRHHAVVVAMALTALAAWACVAAAGVHPTIAGVALGLAAARRPAGHAATVLEPYSNGIVLPLFALSAALVPIPTVGVANLSPAFWGIVVALPVGKFVGITAAGWVSGRLAARRGQQVLSGGDIVTVACLGGIGFTVALLMNTLAFAGDRTLSDEGTLAVLIGSGIAIVVSGVVVTLRSRGYERRMRAASIE